MDAKNAIRAAKRYVAEVFEDEQPSNIGLEEVEHEAGIWRVTVGFSRPWDFPRTSILDGFSPAPQPLRRVYKTVLINDGDGEVIAVKNRDVDLAA